MEAFNITSYDTRSLEIAIISVLAKLKAADFDELIKILLKEKLEGRENLIKNITKYSNVDYFYAQIKQRFGYKEKAFIIVTLVTQSACDKNVESEVIEFQANEIAVGVRRAINKSTEKFTMNDLNEVTRIKITAHA